MNELRGYQRFAVDRARTLVKEGKRRIILQAPTGSGKSVIVREIIVRLSANRKRSVFVAPRAEIVEQLSKHLDDVGIDHGVLVGSHWRARPWLPVQVATSATLLRRDVPPPDVLFIDEAHLHIDSAKALVERFPRALIIGTTATPARLDGRGLKEVYEVIVPVVSVRTLIDAGHLCEFQVFAPFLPALDAVRTTAGDYNKKDLAALMDKPSIIGNVVDHWIRLANGRSTIVYAVSVEASKKLALAFREHGVNAEHTDAETPAMERADVVDRLRNGRLTVACNVELFTYGLDVPCVSCVVVARPTKSLPLHLQMLGRGLRPHPGKENLLVLDHSFNTLMHGFPDMDREWSLDGIVKKPGQRIPALRLPCEVCGAVCPSSALVCTLCGNFFPKKPRIVLHRPGELEEVGATMKSRAASFNPTQRAERLAGWMDADVRNGWSRGRAYAIYKSVFGPLDPAIEREAQSLLRILREKVNRA